MSYLRAGLLLVLLVFAYSCSNTKLSPANISETVVEVTQPKIQPPESLENKKLSMPW